MLTLAPAPATTQQPEARLQAPQLPPPKGALVPSREPDHSYGTRVWIIAEIVESCCGDWLEAIPHLVVGQIWDGTEWLYAVREESRDYVPLPATWYLSEHLSAAPWDLMLERPVADEEKF